MRKVFNRSWSAADVAMADCQLVERDRHGRKLQLLDESGVGLELSLQLFVIDLLPTTHPIADISFFEIRQR